MRKPVVDYRDFRLSKLNDPRFSHLKLLSGWVVYLLFYVLTENLIPEENCHPVHCFLDDLIPFNEWFIIPYVTWYVLIVGSLLYFLLYDVENFRNLQKYIIITQAVAMTVYILFPNRQDLRPETFLRDNPLTRLVGLIYSVDTNTGVCPSLHAAYSLGIASAWMREKSAAPLWKGFIAALAALICVSVTFVKQHSAVDVLAALPVCLLAEWIVFGRKRCRPPEKAKQ